MLGKNYILRGRDSEAADLLRDSLAKFRRTLGYQDPHTLRIEYLLADCLNSQEQFVEAEFLAKRVLLVLEEHFIQHPDIFINAARGAVMACHGQGRSEEALGLLEHTLEKSIRHYGHGHAKTLALKSEINRRYGAPRFEQAEFPAEHNS